MQQTVDEPKRSKTPFILGCCGGGCLAVVIGVIGVIVYMVNFISGLQEPNPTVQLQEVKQEQLQGTQDRFSEYKKRIESGDATTADEFVLSEDEINNAIASFTEADEDSPRVRVQLNGDAATGEISIPIPQDDGTNKWVNGEAEFTVDVTNGKLDIRLKRLKVKGKNIPESFMEGFQKENLAKDVNNDPQFQEDLKNIKKIEIKDSKVHVKLKSSAESAGEVEPAGIPEDTQPETR